MYVFVYACMSMFWYNCYIYGRFWVGECSAQRALLGNVVTDIHFPISLGQHDTYLALVLSVAVTHMLSSLVWPIEGNYCL